MRDLLIAGRPYAGHPGDRTRNLPGEIYDLIVNTLADDTEKVYKGAQEQAERLDAAVAGG